MSRSAKPSSGSPAAPPRRRVILIQEWWSQRMLRGVARYAAERNWILNCDMGWDPRLPVHWKGDGIIAYADQNAEIIEFVRNSGKPVVDLSTWSNLFQAPRVMISIEGIARMAVEHFRQLGFTNLGCVMVSDHVVDRVRYDSFEKEAARTGATFHRIPWKGVARHLAALPRPMGLLTSKDQSALEVIRQCQDLGYAVPEEFAVLGVNDTPILCDFAPVPVTSVDPDFERNGYEAAALLDRLLDGQPAPEEPIVIPPRCITLRRSTDTLYVPDLDTARALRHLRDHFLTLAGIGDVADGSPTRLRKIQKHFRRHTGRTLVQEWVRLRLEHARKLLLDPANKIERIAHDSGFASRTHFVRMFKRAYGMSPRAFRQAQST